LCSEFPDASSALYSAYMVAERLGTRFLCLQ
jgi:hypothetical protein